MVENLFLTDVQMLRVRERVALSGGAVTAYYEGDVEAPSACCKRWW